MARPAESEGTNPPEKPDTQIRIGMTPRSTEGIVFQRDPDGRQTIILQGELVISLPSQLALPEQRLAAPQSPATDAEIQSSSLLPESTPAPVSEPHKAAERASHDVSAKEEDENNQKHIFTGRVASEPYYRERKRSGKPLADFVLAEHPRDEETVFHRIRAFGAQAEKIRDHMAKGQQVEVTAYGPKHWLDPVKREGRWTKDEREGYYAGFVKVPKEAAKEPPAKPET